MKPKTLSLIASASLLALIALCLAWEAVIAPLRPGGSWMTLKVIPLMFALFGILRGTRYTYQWSCMMILLYLTEGVIRGHHERRATRRFVQVAQALAYRIQIGIDAVQAGPFGFRQQGFQLAAPRRFRCVAECGIAHIQLRFDARHLIRLRQAVAAT